MGHFFRGAHVTPVATYTFFLWRGHLVLPPLKPPFKAKLEVTQKGKLDVPPFSEINSIGSFRGSTNYLSGLAGGFKPYFMFTPSPAEMIPIWLYNIFQMSWNHQPAFGIIYPKVIPQNDTWYHWYPNNQYTFSNGLVKNHQLDRNFLRYGVSTTTMNWALEISSSVWSLRLVGGTTATVVWLNICISLGNLLGKYIKK